MRVLSITLSGNMKYSPYWFIDHTYSKYQNKLNYYKVIKNIVYDIKKALINIDLL